VKQISWSGGIYAARGDRAGRFLQEAQLVVMVHGIDLLTRLT
jgi:hypothetical protein